MNTDLKALGDFLKGNGTILNEEELNELARQLEKDFSYIPRIGVFGKTGAGKSSLVNAVFGQDVCPVSDVESCTRQIKEQNVSGIVLIDCPGIAESEERDLEYYRLYSDLIPTLDAIIWVLQGDSHSYGPDLKFYNLIKDNLKTKEGKNAPLFFALNQVDKVEPYREWDMSLRIPGPSQKCNIEKIVKNVSAIFGVASSHVIPVSASEKYNITSMMSELLYALPENQAIIVSGEIDKGLAKYKEEQEREIQKLRNYNKELAAERERLYRSEVEKVEDAKEKSWEKLLRVGKEVIKVLIKYGPTFFKIFKKPRI